MLEPDFYFESVFKISYEKLWENNIRGLIFDIDNTLTAYDEKQPSPETVKLLGKLCDMGFRLCLLTNNTNRRLESFNENLKLAGFANALKPFSYGVKKALKKMEVTSSQAAIIGDQLLTDVWAGKRSGVMTVLVRPITQKDFAFVRFKRLIEKRMLKKFFAKLEKE